MFRHSSQNKIQAVNCHWRPELPAYSQVVVESFCIIVIIIVLRLCKYDCHFLSRGIDTVIVPYTGSLPSWSTHAFLILPDQMSSQDGCPGFTLNLSRSGFLYQNVQNTCAMSDNGSNSCLSVHGIKESVTFCAHIHFRMFIHFRMNGPGIRTCMPTQTQLTQKQEITGQLTLSVSELSVELIGSIPENTCTGMKYASTNPNPNPNSSFSEMR